MADSLPGMPVVRLPYDQITITEAAGLVDDGDRYWLLTMPAVLHFYPAMTIDRYWQLSVREHRELVGFLVRSELMEEPDGDEH